MIHGDLENDRLKLREVPFSRFMEIEQWFEDPELHAVAARHDAYDALRLYRQIFCTHRLRLWDVLPAGTTDSVGYATLFRRRDVEPNIYVYFFADAFDDAVAQDVTTLMAHTAFPRCSIQALDYILPVTGDLDDPFVRFLLDSGFDPNPGAYVNRETETCFTMQRHTYDAYYGSDSGTR